MLKEGGDKRGGFLLISLGNSQGTACQEPSDICPLPRNLFLCREPHGVQTNSVTGDLGGAEGNPQPARGP